MYKQQQGNNMFKIELIMNQLILICILHIYLFKFIHLVLTIIYLLDNHLISLDNHLFLSFNN
jgi:hypothetical protein